MLVVWQAINVVAAEVLALAFKEPMVVRLVNILNILLRLMRLTPGSSTTASGLLCYSQGYAFIEGSAVECHLAGIGTAGDTDAACINLCHLRP